MGLLEKTFPGLAEIDQGIPVWEDNEKPWSILGNSANNLIDQIIEKNGGKEGPYIDPTAIIGEFVTIEGECYIGPRAEIRQSAYLRKGSWVCEDAVVGHSTEVKNSVLLPRSKAPHFNYVGDSIVGIDANLGAGVKLSNVRNDRGEVVVTLQDGVREKTGLKKMGALVGDGSQIGCNVVTNPGAILLPFSMVPPNETITGLFGS